MESAWGELNNQLVQSAKEKKIPLMGAFELTARCNLSCKMCYVNRPANDPEALQKELSANQWISLAKEARDAGMLYLLFTGGEVFLRADFKEICEEISRLGVIVSIITNGTLITSKIAKWLSKIPLLKIGVTLYGSSSATYEKVCGRANGFEMATRGLDFLLSENIPIRVRTTIVKENKSDFFDLVNFTKMRNISIGVVNYISPGRHEKVNCAKYERLQPLDLVHFEKEIFIFGNKKSLLEKTNQKQFSDIKDFIINKEKDSCNNQDFENAFSCGAGNYSFWTTWEGHMTPCVLMADPRINIQSTIFNNAWNSLIKLCKSIPKCLECDKCVYKSYCDSCPARLENESGSFDRISPYLCETAKLRYKMQQLL